MKDTRVLWFTGLSGSGKTTIANRLVETLEEIGQKVMLIDGDKIRSTKHKNLTFTPEDIRENNNLILGQCIEKLGQYDFILVSIISPFRESRENARRSLNNHFVEIFVKTDLQECIRRDVKGLYKKALSGEIENFIGISSRTPYEEPVDSEISIDTKEENVVESVNKIMNYLSTQTK